MRHRKKIPKVTLSHSIYAPELLPVLERLAVWDEVKSINPGTITRTGGHHEFRLKIQYDTPQGVKCLAVTTSATQEVFVVTGDREAFRKHLNDMFPHVQRTPKVKEPPKPKPKLELPHTACGTRGIGKCRICQLCKRCATHQAVLTRCNCCPDKE